MRQVRTSAVLAATFFVSVLAMGCGPAFTANQDSGGGGGGGGPAPVTFQFQIPNEQDLVDRVITLGVTGSGVDRAIFLVDRSVVADVISPPFEYVLDPQNFVLGEHELRIEAKGNGGGQNSPRVNVVLDRAVPLQDILGAITNLAETHWYQIPNTRMRAVTWDDTPGAPGTTLGDVRDIINAANGAAFDTRRRQLLIWGGREYKGNEVYAFDLDTARWERLTDPTAIEILTDPAGAPETRHSGNALLYVPAPIDRMFMTGGFGDGNTYMFDLDALTWEVKGSFTPNFSDDSPTSVLGANGTVWSVVSGRLREYDEVADTWTPRSSAGNTWPIGLTGAVDPDSNEMLTIGRSHAWVWDLDNPDDAPTKLAFTGDTEILDASSPGMVYHAASDRMIAWAGETSVYSIDLGSLTITRIDSTSPVTPGEQNARGTYGRWRYDFVLDAFIVVSSIDENVWAYKLPATVP